MPSDLTAFNQLPQFYHLEQKDLIDKPVEVYVTGEMPHWLNGSLYRNGAGLFKVGDTAWNHLFDGFAVLQRWTICQGKVTYQCSALDSEIYKKTARHRKIVGEGFGSSFPDPCETLFGRLFNWFIPKASDNTNVNVMEFGDRLFALTELPTLNEINPDTLTVKDKNAISDYVAVHLGTAHPHKLKDGTSLFYGTNMIHHKAYNFIAIPPQAGPSKPLFSGAKIVATIPSRWKMHISYTHSFGITEQYFVHLEQPLTMSIPRAMLYKPLGRNGIDVIVPHEGESMDILLISRSTGKRLPVTYRAPEGVVFHFINCYEDSGHVVCDVCFLPEGAKSVHRIYFNIMVEDAKTGFCFKPMYTRFVLPTSLCGAEEKKNLVTLTHTTATAFLQQGSKTVVCVYPEVFGENMSADFPAINYDYNGIKHRFCYTSTAISSAQRMLSKFDVLEKTVKIFEVSEDFNPSEPVFVARPGATREDDGVVLATIVAASSSVQSYMVVLDATTFQEIARASLPSEMKMSFTFHGIFTDKKPD